MLGGRGFIGSHLVPELAKRGHNVSILDRNYRPEPTEILGNGLLFGSGEEKVPDVVVHLAGNSNRGSLQLYPSRALISNVEVTSRLITEFPWSRHIFLSSSLVYGNIKAAANPYIHPKRPICVYGKSKSIAEDVMELGTHNFVILRGFNVFGPNMRGLHFLTELGKAHKNGTTMNVSKEMYLNEVVSRDFIHVDDVVDLIIKASESSVTGIYNVGSGESYKLTNLCEYMNVEYKLVPISSYDVIYTKAHISDTKFDFEWEPDTTKIWEFLDGLR